MHLSHTVAVAAGIPTRSSSCDHYLQFILVPERGMRVACHDAFLPAFHACEAALVTTATRGAVNQPQHSEFVRLVEGRILAK